MGWRNRLIRTGFGVIGATRMHKLAAPHTGGRGAILTFHHVRPALQREFRPNRLLEITPAFLDLIITRVRQLGYDIVSLDEALARLAGPARGRRFIVLTLDDGYRDNLDCALPVLERHGAPAVFYIAPGFAERTARLWWVELEEAIRRADRVRLRIDGEAVDLPAATRQEKLIAFAGLYWRLRRGSEARLLDVIGQFAAAQGVDGAGLVADLCLDWDGIAELARHPLATIGAHTMSHLMLAKHPEARVRAELCEGRAVLERRLGRPVRHLAYPVGDRTSAGEREFAVAAEAGYASAVTTRPGLVYSVHGAHLTALPRVSVNGNHQSLANLEVLLSGLAFTLWNKGRRVV